MSPPRIGRTGLRSPRGWLFLAFLGVSLYLASQLLRLYPARVAEIVVLPAPEVKEILALTSGLGQLLFFGGLVAALLRAHLAAGGSHPRRAADPGESRLRRPEVSGGQSVGLSAVGPSRGSVPRFVPRRSARVRAHIEGRTPTVETPRRPEARHRGNPQ